MASEEARMVNSAPSSTNRKVVGPAKRPKMVDWYAPLELIQTGVRTLVSTTLGAMIDTRTILAGNAEMEDCVFDYSDRESFSFDYIADTGDGWNSTYSMAYLLTSEELEVEGAGSHLPRSEVVILGGDEVYPVANKGAYYSRLTSPWEQAAIDVRIAKRAATGNSQASLKRKELFMIPGNHDWYDGLGSMSRRYFSYFSPEAKNPFGRQRKPRKLGQFDTYQARSYFVLVLPHDWEIWAVDVQLGEDIDPDQYAFFSWRSQALTDRSKVLLCSAVPTIVFGEQRDKDSLTFGLDRVSGLVKGKGARTCAQLAGDVHNYQRYEIAKQTKTGIGYTRQHIVCGGGGAFLHPNHSFHKGTEASPRVEPVTRYPSREGSKALSRRILLFPFEHVGMCAFIGLLYLLMFWQEGPPGGSGLATYLVNHPISSLIAAAAVFGCMAFAAKKRLWGFLHGAAHVVVAVLSWKVAESATQWLSEPLSGLGFAGLEPLVHRVSTFALGGFLGGALFGFYLWASLEWLRLHHNEAFSSLSWPHQKAFLRCKVEGDGSLTVHVIGVDRTAAETDSHPVKTHLVERFTIS